MLAYLASTVLIFAFGPVDWPVDNWPSLLIFLCAVASALFIGYRLGTAAPAAGTEFRAWRWVFLLGATATVILLFPAAHLYAGKMPWGVLDALQDQGEAYREFQDNLALTSYSDRAVVAITRTVVAPFALAAVPLGILHWADLPRFLRLLLGATILSTIIFSSLRGTDREMADLVIIFFSTLLIAVTRSQFDRR